jgi:hypothetical protein
MMQTLSQRPIEVNLLNQQQVVWKSFKDLTLKESIKLTDPSVIVREAILGYSKEETLLYARSL